MQEGKSIRRQTFVTNKQKYDLFLLGSAWCRHQHLHCRTNVLIYHGPDPRYWTGTWVSYELVHIQNDIFIPPWFPYNFIGIWTISMIRFWSIASSWLHQINSISVIVVIYFRVIDTLRMWDVRVCWSCIFFWGMVSGGGELKISAANRLIGEVVQSRRRPLLGPSPCWKRLLAFLYHVYLPWGQRPFSIVS